MEHKSDIADITLAETGRLRVEWAKRQMPVLQSICNRFEVEKPLKGLRIAVCLHVTAETANLIHTLVAGGAEVVACAANPLSTQDDVAATLVGDTKATVFAKQNEDFATYRSHIQRTLDLQPQITMDDGADLVSTIHSERQELTKTVIGGTEETTTGVLRLRALAGEGTLQFPVIAVNTAQTKHLFDNRHGTGQSTLDGILRATNILFAGQVVVVFGYGWCGKGVAQRACGAGATTLVCEIDPLRALEAKMDGFEVVPSMKAAERGNIFITATGNRDVLRREHFALMPDGAILCNTGHFDVEIDLKALREISSDSPRTVRPSVSEYTVGGKRLYLLCEGRVVNLAAAEGHPASVMDMSFANQALAIEHLAKNHQTLDPKVHNIPKEFDEEIAQLKLQSLGVTIDTLTKTQHTYLRSWR